MTKPFNFVNMFIKKLKLTFSVLAFETNVF